MISLRAKLPAAFRLVPTVPPERVFSGVGHGNLGTSQKAAGSSLGLPEIRRKTQRCVTMRVTVLKIRITRRHKCDRNVCEVGSRNASKVLV